MTSIPIDQKEVFRKCKWCSKPTSYVPDGKLDPIRCGHCGELFIEDDLK